MSKSKSTTPVEPTLPIDISGWHEIKAGDAENLLKIMKGKCCEHCGDAKDLSYKVAETTFTIRCALCHCEHVFPIELLDT